MVKTLNYRKLNNYLLYIWVWFWLITWVCSSAKKRVFNSQRYRKIKVDNGKSKSTNWRPLIRPPFFALYRRCQNFLIFFFGKILCSKIVNSNGTEGWFRYFSEAIVLLLKILFLLFTVKLVFLRAEKQHVKK